MKAVPPRKNRRGVQKHPKARRATPYFLDSLSEFARRKLGRSGRHLAEEGE